MIILILLINMNKLGIGDYLFFVLKHIFNFKKKLFSDEYEYFDIAMVHAKLFWITISISRI